MEDQKYQVIKRGFIFIFLLFQKNAVAGWAMLLGIIMDNK